MGGEGGSTTASNVGTWSGPQALGPLRSGLFAFRTCRFLVKKSSSVSAQYRTLIDDFFSDRQYAENRFVLLVISRKYIGASNPLVQCVTER